MKKKTVPDIRTQQEHCMDEVQSALARHSCRLMCIATLQGGAWRRKLVDWLTRGRVSFEVQIVPVEKAQVK